MKPIAEFLACLKLDATGLAMRPLGTDQFLLKITVTRALLDGRNTPEQNCLSRAIEPHKDAILASLGYHHTFGLALMAGTTAGNLAVVSPETRTALEVMRFGLPESWSELVGNVDIGNYPPDDWHRDFDLVVSREKKPYRTRQASKDDMNRLKK